MAVVGFLANSATILDYFNLRLKNYDELVVSSFTHFSIAPNFISSNHEDGITTLVFRPIFKLTNTSNSAFLIHDFGFSVANSKGLRMGTNRNPPFEIVDEVDAFMPQEFLEGQPRISSPTYPFLLSPNSSIFVRILFRIAFYDQNGSLIKFQGTADQMNDEIDELFGMSAGSTDIERINHTLYVVVGEDELAYKLNQWIPIIGKGVDLSKLKEKMEPPQAPRFLNPENGRISY